MRHKSSIIWAPEKFRFHMFICEAGFLLVSVPGRALLPLRSQCAGLRRVQRSGYRGWPEKQHQHNGDHGVAGAIDSNCAPHSTGSQFGPQFAPLPVALLINSRGPDRSGSERGWVCPRATTEHISCYYSIPEAGTPELTKSQGAPVENEPPTRLR